MSPSRVLVLTALAMTAFAGNSLLCRVALKETAVDAATFTTIRLVSGALMLAAIARTNRGARSGGGNWPSAMALFVYAAGFSFAYVSLPAATGALLLFGAVQATMIGRGLWAGERLRRLQLLGLVLALLGLGGLLLPGLSAPPLAGALLMLGAGVAWGIYSLRGRGAGDPTKVTAGNFLLAVPFAIALSAVTVGRVSFDVAGAGYALASGALASGIGYAIWYTALPALPATSAATVQLSVPVLAALGGIVFLGEPITPRLVLASVAILGGIALVILEKRKVVVGVVVLVAGMSSACGPGPGKLAVATQPGANNVHLVIGNGGPNAARPLITLNDRILFDERVEPSVETPAIVANRWTTLPDRRYRIDVLDRLSGRTATAKFRLRGGAGIFVTVLPEGISIATTDDPRELLE